MIIARSVPELRAASSGPVSFVPTMGALHAGHASLIRLAAADGVCTVVSDFVNPLQFGKGEDFENYPRDLAADAELAEQAGATVLFAPSVTEVYPPDFSTTIDPGPLAHELCGLHRPGHFAGVATVVVRLFGLVQPHRAIFGSKDYQQLTILRRVNQDLGLGIEIVGAPTIRDEDGLALSSRNMYLSPAERIRARAIPRALQRAAEIYAAGERDAVLLAEVSHSVLDGLTLEYLELRCSDLTNYEPDRPAVLLVAGRVGNTRLIDNIVLDPASPTQAIAQFATKEFA
ncbi:MAG: pantoate--beta-alanine ligase [Thermoleophilia bacterium]|nr:pantoate--beta-alanine ligase [Thermoleophilia bacterium]